MKLDGKEIELGSKMWSPIGGWGKVINMDDIGWFEVHFGERECTEIFSFEGAFYRNGPRCIFWDEIDLTPPNPKMKVKKWRWAYEWHDNGLVFNNVTGHMTEKEMNSRIRCSNGEMIGKIESTEIEVEE